MDIKPFTLANKHNPNEIFAVGLSIVRDGGDEEAVTYRRDPNSQHTLFAVFASAEAACTRYSRTVAPMTLNWLFPEKPTPRACPGQRAAFPLTRRSQLPH